MPIANMLINEASVHHVISFLDGNDKTAFQIFMVEEDSLKWPLYVPDLLVYLSGLL